MLTKKGAELTGSRKQFAMPIWCKDRPRTPGKLRIVSLEKMLQCKFREILRILT